MDAVIAALLSGALFHFSTGLNNVWPLAWLAPLPVLWLAYGGGSGRRTALAAFCAFLLGQLHLFEAYMVIGLPLLVMMIIIAAVFALCVLFGRFAARRLPPLLAALAFPTAWTAWEFLSSLVSPHGSFGALGYSQVSAPVLIQGASLFGMWWVSFLICATASFAAMAIRRPAARGRLLIVAAVLFAANLGFGLWRLEQPQGPRIRVAAIADDRLGKDAGTADAPHATEATTAYAAHARAAASRADFIVLPEKFAFLKPDYQAQALAPLQQAADETGAAVLAGFDDKGTNANEALLFRPHAAPFAYSKRHMIPGLETGYIPGKGPGLFAPGRSIAICKDMDFPQTLRSDARNHIGLMLVPAWDFDRDAWAHARMAVMRGVEGGYAIVRTAQHGLSTVTDAEGRVLARTTSAEGAPAVAEVPTGPGTTLYVRIGDVFGWLCAAAAAILLAAGVPRRPSPLTSGRASV